MCNIFFPLIQKFIEFEFDEQQRNVFKNDPCTKRTNLQERKKKKNQTAHFICAPYDFFMRRPHKMRYSSEM